MYKFIKCFTLLFLFFLLCNCSSENGTKNIYNSKKIDQYEANKNIEDVNSTQDQKYLSESDAYSNLLERLLIRGLGKSCANVLPKNNIKLLSRLSAETSENSKSEYSSFRLKTKLNLYYIKIYECYKIDENSLYSSRNPKFWGFVQDGISGEIIKEYCSFPQIVNIFLKGELDKITGHLENEEDSGIKSDSTEAEIIRKQLLNDIK